MISAHWLTPGETRVTYSLKPRTLHDFGRIDARLFQMHYPASGALELADQLIEEFADLAVTADAARGFDHGVWCVLCQMYPQADIPVVQLSIDYAQAPRYHFELGQRLRNLRHQGVLIVSSGNIVHNLGYLKFPEHSSYDWAIEFDQYVKKRVDQGDYEALLDYKKLGRAAQLSIPTPDHYLPFLVTLGLITPDDALSYPTEGMSFGSTSMRSLLLSPSETVRKKLIG